jgi:hypothetical protein
MRRSRIIIVLFLSATLLLGVSDFLAFDGSFRDALRNGQVETVRDYLKSGEDVNGRVEYPGPSQLMTPLNIAAQNGDYHLAKLLISFGANPAVTNSYGNTPLLDFLGADDKPWDRKLFGLLLTTDLNTVNVDGQTALLYAAAYRDEYYVTNILVRGGNINYQDSQGRTALHGAKTATIAKVLLQHGADKTILDNDHRNPQEAALLEKRLEVAQAIAGFPDIR